jgi:hypothetical protein
MPAPNIKIYAVTLKKHPRSVGMVIMPARRLQEESKRFGKSAVSTKIVKPVQK